MAEPANDISPVARQHLKRNFCCGVLNGVAYRVAETMIDPTLVLTWFLTQLTSSSLIIGLVAPLRSAGWFLPQLLVSGYAQRQERRITIYRVFGIVRALAIASLAAAIWLIGAQQVPMLIVFFLCLALLSFGEGFSGISFMDIVAKAIPPRRRGSFFALRNFVGGTFALGSGAVVRYVLSKKTGLSFPINFVLDIAPAAERPIYIGLINTVLGFASLALMLSGVIVLVTGYEVLFLLTIGFFILAFVAALGLRDPSFESGQRLQTMGGARK